MSCKFVFRRQKLNVPETYPEQYSTRNLTLSMKHPVMYVLSATKKAPPKNYTNPRRILLGFRFHADEAGSGKIFHPRQRKMPCKDGAKNNNPRNWLLCEEFRHNKFRVWLLHCDCPHRDACFYSNYLIIIVDSMVWKKFKFHGRIRKESVNSFDCVSWKYRMTCLFLLYLVRKPTSLIFFSELCSRRIFRPVKIQKMYRSEML